MILLDMEMPENCWGCPMQRYTVRSDDYRCVITGKFAGETEGRSVFCPIKAEIPKDATNGDVMKAMFPTLETRTNNDDDDFIDYTLDGVVGHCVEKRWWNAPWKGQENAE